MAGLIAGTLGGSAISGLFGMAGGKAQANAAKYAANLQAQLGQESLGFQEKEWQQQQGNMAPWVQAGQGAVTHLSDLMNQGLGGGGPLAPWTQQFTAPTLAQAEQEPGYQFALSQGSKALENSALASGGGLTGNAGEALTQFGQNLGEENYQNVYNRAMQQYQLGYNQYQQNQANLFNRYASLAGLGQTASGQLGSEGQAAASNVGGINATIGGQVGANINNAAAAQASGYVGAGNAIGGGVESLGQYAMLQNLINGGSNNFQDVTPDYLSGPLT